MAWIFKIPSTDMCSLRCFIDMTPTGGRQYVLGISCNIHMLVPASDFFNLYYTCYEQLASNTFTGRIQYMHRIFKQLSEKS